MNLKPASNKLNQHKMSIYFYFQNLKLAKFININLINVKLNTRIIFYYEKIK